MALQVDDVQVEVGRAATEGTIDMVELWLKTLQTCVAGPFVQTVSFQPCASNFASCSRATRTTCWGQSVALDKSPDGSSWRRSRFTWFILDHNRDDT